MDHNICLTIGGGCRILTYLADGKPNWGISKPGVYGDHITIDRRGAEGEFVNFDPAKFVFDLRLKSGATAIGAGGPCGGALGGHHRSRPRKSGRCWRVPL